MNRIQRLLAVGAAVIGAIAFTGTSANAEEASPHEVLPASGDFSTQSEVETPDGYRVNFAAGYVEWNDYADDDHSIDYDNIWVVGKAGDGKTFRVTATYNGETITKSVGDGSRATISFSTNVVDETGPTWYACVLNNGAVESCSNYYYFEE